MKRKGWTKNFKREFDWFMENKLSDREIVYWLAAKAAAEWRQKSDMFGTFDARTEEMKKWLGWSSGKINTVKNLLLEKGMFQETKDSRLLYITNAHLFLSKGKESEKIIYEAEENLQICELKIHPREYFPKRIKQEIKDLLNGMKMGRSPKTQDGGENKKNN